MDILMLKSGIREKAIKLLGLVLLVFSSITLAADIQLTWDKPVEREDGSAIQEIEKYNLYHTVNNVLQDVIEVSSSDTSYTAFNVQSGVHTYQMTAVEAGQEGEKSHPVSKAVNLPLTKRFEVTIKAIN